LQALTIVVIVLFFVEFLTMQRIKLLRLKSAF